MRRLSLDRARRIALTATGLARPRPPAGVRRDVRHLRRVLRDVDVVQVDSVNVLTRAHAMPFFSRIGAHDHAARDTWLWHSREVYEGWVHAASLTWTETWPLLAHRRRLAPGRRRVRHLLGTDPSYVDAVHDEVAERGPISLPQLTDPGERTGPWWGQPKGKIALDHLARRGELAVDHRTATFVTVYDLAERVIPAAHFRTPPPPETAAHRALLLRAARAQGVATAADLADHHRLPLPAARSALADLVADGELEEVEVAGWGAEPAFLHPQATAARRPSARALLAPFDPLVWNRDRIERLFGFRYRIEIYVPAAERVHGYYVLPFLLGDRLVARVDLRADRRRRRLEVLGAFTEPGVDRPTVAIELAAELVELAGWLGLTEVAISDRGDLAAALRRATP